MNAQKKYCANCFVVMEWERAYCPRCTYPQPFDINPLYLRPPFRLHHQYVIGRTLGHGAFGITYLAYDRSLKVKVAIKEYFPAEYASRNQEDMSVMPYPGPKHELFLSGKRKFIAEAQLLSSLRSPYIIRIRHFFEECNTAYFVMEYLEGQTLEDYLIGRGGRISFEQMRPIMTALLDALEEVHTNNSYHRDIKPANIYMTLQEHPILLDFGSARQETANRTATFALLTPGFAPIEQYSSHGIQGPWTDIYGVAATVYYALTGDIPPYPQDRLTGDAELPALKSLGAKLRPEDEAWLFKGLEVRWNDRPSSVAEWRRQLPPPPRRAHDNSQNNYSSADENFIRFAILPKLANRFLTPEAEAEILESGGFLNIPRARIHDLIERALQMTGSLRRDPRQELAAAAAKREQLEAQMREKQQAENAHLTFSEIFQPTPLFVAHRSLPEKITSSTGMEFVLITPFTQGKGFHIPRPFAMGEPPQRYSVTLTQQYYLQRHPVTQSQWRRIMGNNPAFFQNDDELPIEQVSWEDAQEFIRRLNLLGEGVFRLPYEAEWEYACRAQKNTAYFFGSDPKQLNEYAWFNDNAEGHSHRVGTRQPNPLGIHDLYGNVWEWVQDAYAPFPEGHASDPKGPETGATRVLRGGSWMTDAEKCQTWARWHQAPQASSFQIGFRLLLEAGLPT
ncbi:MAG: SUMF1/EgtB/PvdO family nonheme iron enzyme [Candidatus Sericytochromatia bacterium]